MIRWELWQMRRDPFLVNDSWHIPHHFSYNAARAFEPLSYDVNWSRIWHIGVVITPAEGAVV